MGKYYFIKGTEIVFLRGVEQVVIIPDGSKDPSTIRTPERRN